LTVTLEGTLQELLQQLRDIKEVVDQVAASGFDATNPEFIYRYRTAGDERVCADCIGDDNAMMNGREIQSHFPNAVYVGEGLWFINRHDKCRCTGDLENAGAACAKLLMENLKTK